MSVNLLGRSLLTLADYSREEIVSLVDLADRLKAERKAGVITPKLTGKSVALLFEKRSTRTRCAFETACSEEGAHPVFLSSQDIQLGAKETIEDTARVLGRMFDAVEYRGYGQNTVEALAEYSGVPVYNGLTDEYHPTQVLADLMTLREEFGSLEGRTLAYVGDGRNNVARSLAIGCARTGVRFRVASPAELAPSDRDVSRIRSLGGSGADFAVTTDPREAVAGADAVYTDVWVSMGEEAKEAERKRLLAPFRVTEELMRATGRNDAIFLHCLPAVRGNEVTAEVIDGRASRVFDEAENRKHTIRALLVATLAGISG